MIRQFIDEVHTSVTRRWYLQLFTAFTRVLLAVGFIPPSYTKIMHRPFTMLPASDPVGAYFIALYNTGVYYEFIGWAQMIAAILLLIPRTSHVGALLFLPIVVNIAVLTSSVGFAGTWILTILMSLAAAWLVSWEYDRLRPIIFPTRRETTRKLPFEFVSIPLLFAAGGAAMSVVWRLLRLGNFPDYAKVAGLLAVGGAVFGLAVAVHYRFMPVGNLTDASDK